MMSAHNTKYFVFYDSCCVGSFDNWIAQISPISQVVIFEIADHAPTLYRQQFRCVTYEHFFTQKDFDHIDEVALRIAQGWYVIADDDFSLDTIGVSLGRVVEYEAMIQFVSAIKHLALLNAIVAEEGPVIFVCFDRYSPIGQALAVFENTSTGRVEWQVKKTNKPQRRWFIFSSDEQIKILTRGIFQRLLVLFMKVRRFFCKRPELTQRCRLLFYSSFGQYLDYLKGVVADGFAESFVYDFSVTSWREIVKMNVNLIMKDTNRSRSIKTNSDWQKRWSLLQQKPRFLESFNYHGLRFWPIVQQFLENLFLNHFPQLEHTNINLFRMLKKHQFDLVIVPQDVKDVPRLLVLVAQSLGIPTLVTEHGIVANYKHRVLPLADKIALWGKGDIDYYLRHGYERERLAVIGHPAIEKLATIAACKLESKGRRNFSLDDSNNLLILFAAQPYVPISAQNSPVEIVDMLQMVVEACRGRTNWQLIIKLHPAMNGHELLSIDTTEVNFIVIKHSNIYDLIAMSDVVVTWCSTVGLEALVIGKPLVAIQIPGKDDYVPYVSSKVALGVSSAQELTLAIEAMFSNQDMMKQRKYYVKAFIQTHLESDECGAVDRFIDLIKQIGEC